MLLFKSWQPDQEFLYLRPARLSQGEKMKIDVYSTDIVFKRVLKEDHPRLSPRQINKMMMERGYKLFSIGKLPKYVKEFYDLEDLHHKVKVFVKLTP